MEFGRLGDFPNINNVETNSFIAHLSYDIETHLHGGYSPERIRRAIEELQQDGRWPEHIQFLDAMFDSQTGGNAVAFLDTRTGEITIGHAGTNFGKGVGGWNDIRANVGIAFGGINPNGRYARLLREFVNNVKDDNPQFPVTTVTGHSLGGKLAQLTGLYHDLNIVTFNSAPLRGNPWLSVNLSTIMRPKFGASTLVRSIRSARWTSNRTNAHTGSITHFYSSRDELTNIANATASRYAGELILVDNGGGHSMSVFLNSRDQDFIRRRVPSGTSSSNRRGEIAVEFRDGKFTIPAGLRSPANLLRGGAVRLNPDVLHAAINNMNRLNRHRFGVINELISMSRSQNGDLSSNRTGRLQTLVDTNFRFMIEAGYDPLVTSFRTSFALVELNIPTLRRLRDTRIPTTSALIDNFRNRHIGTNSNTRWFVNGSFWIGVTIQNRYNTLINEITSLHRLATTEPLDRFFNQVAQREFPRNGNCAQTSVYVSRFNGLVTPIRRVVRGQDIRSNLTSDAIVQTMTDVLNVLRESTRNASRKDSELVMNGRIIANNVQNFDSQMASAMSDGRTIGQASGMRQINNVVQITNNRSERLARNESITRAMNEQVDFRSGELFNRVINQIQPLNSALIGYAQSMINHCDRVQTSIDSLNEFLSRRMSSQNSNETTRQERLVLRSYIPANIIADIGSVRTFLISWESGFRTVQTRATEFRNQLSRIASRLRREVERAIYPHDEMRAKVHAAKSVTEMLEASAVEYSMLASQIRRQMNGATITGYATELERTAREYRRIIRNIEEDFGIRW